MKIHRWLGFISGLPVFVIAITGCLYAFKTEIENVTQPYRFVKTEHKPLLPPSALKHIAETELPEKKIHSIVYERSGRAVQAIFFNIEPDYYYYEVFIDPYDGKITKVKDMEDDFFQIVLNGHFYLWLPPAVGQPVTATASLVFFSMMITGIILWWPRTRQTTRQRFTVKWNSRWRRKNFDLHSVLGFYVMTVALVLAVTGLVWGFEWFAKTYYALAGGERSLTYEDPGSIAKSNAHSGMLPIDEVWYTMKKEYPDAASIEIHIPGTTSSSIAANANPERETYWQTDYRYFDQYTLAEVSVNHIYGRATNTSVADKLIRLNYDIHVGSIGGLPGKVLVFFASLIVASLPVTGFLIWLGRTRK